MEVHRWTRKSAREAIVDAVRFLEDKRLNHGSAGNVSMRFGDGLLVTPTGGRGDWLTPDDIVHIALDGEVRGGGKALERVAFSRRDPAHPAGSAGRCPHSRRLLRGAELPAQADPAVPLHDRQFRRQRHPLLAL